MNSHETIRNAHFELCERLEIICDQYKIYLSGGPLSQLHITYSNNDHAWRIFNEPIVYTVSRRFMRMGEGYGKEIWHTYDTDADAENRDYDKVANVLTIVDDILLQFLNNTRLRHRVLFFTFELSTYNCVNQV